MSNQNPNGGPGNNNNFSKYALLGLAGLMGLSLMGTFNGAAQNPAPRGASEMTYSEFNNAVRQGRVSSVTLQQGSATISGQLRDGGGFTANIPANDPTLIPELKESGANINVLAPPQENTLLSSLLGWAPMLLILGVWLYFMKNMQGGGRNMMGFGGNKAKLLNQVEGRVTFDDVAGIDEAKEDLKEVVDFLRNPGRYQRLGGKMPRGVLLVGPPGTGKTLTARAVAGEAQVPFFSISGSDFVEMFVGVGASRVRQMFEEAKKNAPCIIFIDEIDAVGRHRGAGMGGGNDEREQTLNQLLVEMDGFTTNEGIILIAATNRPDVLDPALLRPGRFDRQITVPNPDLTGRDRILKVHTRKVPLDRDVDTMVIARGTPGFSGADLANLVNEAALLTARRGKHLVGMKEFEDAKDKIMMGAERKTFIMTENEKKLTAYHEGGHAITALHQKGNTDPIHKATIVPRGRALGMVMQLPEGDRVSMNYAQMKARLVILFGGREAERLIFGEENITSGAMSDIQQATRLARAMVTQWGFSDKLGRVQYEGNEEQSFLGHDIGKKKTISEATAALIDEEVKRLTDEAETEARRILTDNRHQLEAIARALLDYETLTGEEVTRVAQGEDIGRQPEQAPAPEQPGTKSAVPASGMPRPPGPAPS